MTLSRKLTPYLYLAPMLALLAFVFGFSILRVFEFSFKMVRGIDGPWIGLRNYELILSHPLFWESVLHNLQLLLAIPVIVGVSLIISVLLFERVAGWKIYRIIVFVPFILATTFGVMNLLDPWLKVANSAVLRTSPSPASRPCKR